uniref:Putative transposase n=1 Tax=Bactrocera tryoni TaxID=59916 RepID=O96691_BACRY|nr:putative transposase [Bactrocera tryoni]
MAEKEDSIGCKIANGSYSLSGKRKGRSFVWNILSEILKPDGTLLEGFVYCRTCLKVLKYYNGQTSNLIRHPCCRNIKTSQELRTVTVEDKNEAVKKFTSWVVEDCRPFSVVQGSGFIKLVKFFIKIGASYGEHVDVEDLLPSATTISRNVQKCANEKKEELKEEINNIVSSGGASATIDMWTDNYVKRNFLGVTFHYQKDLKFFDLVLGMKSMNYESSSGDNVLNKLSSMFKEYGVQNMSQIKFITDRGSNMVKALKQNIRLNCSSHLFSNVLDKSFEETEELTDVLASCKKIVKYFKKANLQHLLPTSLKSQCPTRWNSNYGMIKSIIDNWFEINNIMTDNEQSQRLLHVNVSILKVLVSMCKDFETVFNKLQLCSSPSLCYVLPSILKIKNICEFNNSDIAAISVLKENIRKKIEEIWVVNLSIWHKVATFLYPPAINMQPNDLDDIKNFCISQIQNNAISAPTSATSAGNDSLSPTAISPTLTTHFSFNESNQIDQSHSSSLCSKTGGDTFFFTYLVKRTTPQATEKPEDEVERYSREEVEMTENFNLMEWWQSNQSKYPHLSKFALQIHAIPASSAAAERSFSLAGNLITEKRNRIAPGSVDSLLFLNTYYKNYNA